MWDYPLTLFQEEVEPISNSFKGGLNKMCPNKLFSMRPLNFVPRGIRTHVLNAYYDGPKRCDFLWEESVQTNVTLYPS